MCLVEHFTIRASLHRCRAELGKYMANHKASTVSLTHVLRSESATIMGEWALIDDTSYIPSKLGPSSGQGTKDRSRANSVQATRKH
jgi:hypothetical protein